MIVTKHGFKKKYAFGGSRIFDTIANLLTRIFTSSAAKKIASSALDVGKSVGKSVAKEGAKKALEAGKSAAVDVNAKIEENFTKIYGTRNAKKKKKSYIYKERK